MQIDDMIASFAEKFGVLFRPASPTEIAAAESAGVPNLLLDFYRSFEPNEMGQGEIRLFPLDHLVAEMTDFVPACHLARFGYFAIGGTNFGDPYFVRPAGKKSLMDLPVYLFSHEIDFKSMPKHQIEEFGIKVADNLGDFLQKAVSGELQTDPFTVN